MKNKVEKILMCDDLAAAQRKFKSAEYKTHVRGKDFKSITKNKFLQKTNLDSLTDWNFFSLPGTFDHVCTVTVPKTCSFEL